MSLEILSLCAPEDFVRQRTEDARRGLHASPKTLTARLFHDARAAALFERITRLPEYYLTRAETALLERGAEELVALARPRELLELGTGSLQPTRLLLEALHRHGGRRFVRLEVSPDALRTDGERLTAELPWLEMLGVVGDPERHLDAVPRSGPRLVCLLGSRLGSFSAAERVPFLRQVRARLEPRDHFLLGVDLVKPRARLHAAYNDVEGVTELYNKNLLLVLNRALGTRLDPGDFAHRAFYDPKLERIELRLVALRHIATRLARLDLELVFEPTEELHTLIACKFRREVIAACFKDAGLVLERWLTDEPGDFALALGRPV